MCGITGYWHLNEGPRTKDAERVITEMTQRLVHRGPDFASSWKDIRAHIVLGHCRLAIRDTSPAGNQPMVSESGRSVLTYNGEIYNSNELRRELEGMRHRFRGHSDTEVVLEACEEWGVLNAVRKMNGMFAFAFWDRESQRLSLARDRLGIKPLFWGFNKGTLLFASQPKSFFGHPDWTPEIRKEAVRQYLSTSYIASGLSIYKGIEKLEPGHILQITSDGSQTKNRYWDLKDIILTAAELRSDRNQVIDQLDELLSDAVSRRMVSDVPLGAFLSGGIDSSTVVALMQKCASRPVKTFAVGLRGEARDEAAHARTVAKHLGTEHYELYVDPNDVCQIVTEMPAFYDEPFADLSQIPTYLVSRLARQTVTVCLTGDGGDEVFGGYNSYSRGETLWRFVQRTPRFLRHSISPAIRCLSPQSWDRFFRLVPRCWRPERVGDRAHKMAAMIRYPTPRGIYRQIMNIWPDPLEIAETNDELEMPHNGIESLFPGKLDTFAEFMQAMDTVTYLPDDILTKVDRASMAVSLEARVPLLDHRVIEFAWSLPASEKRNKTEGKIPLRNVLARYVPKDLTERPKTGFGLPMGSWLRGPLRDWAEDLLSEASINMIPDIRPDIVLKKWHEHTSGHFDWTDQLWSILMLIAWLKYRF